MHMICVLYIEIYANNPGKVSLLLSSPLQCDSWWYLVMDISIFELSQRVRITMLTTCVDVRVCSAT